MLMLAVLIAGFCGGMLYEKESTEPIITFYRTQVDEYFGLLQEHDRVIQEKIVELQSAWTEAERYQVALIEAEAQLDEMSEIVLVVKQESAGLLSQVESLKGEGYIPFCSEAEIWEYVKSTGISQRKYAPTTYDCDDFAIDLVVQAYKDKRMVGLWGYPWHLKNFVIKGNHIYAVEPQSNRVSLLATLD